MKSSGSTTEPTEIYRFVLAGEIATNWTSWFACQDMQTDQQGNTVITCEISDQAALFGVLARIRDLGVPLISVRRNQEFSRRT